MIGLATTFLQETITNFFHNSKLLAKYYEPPIDVRQKLTWFKSVTNLQSYRRGRSDARQLALFGAFFDMGLKLALFRQFNSGWQSNFGGFDYSIYRKFPTFFACFLVSSPFAVLGDMTRRAYLADRTFPAQLQKGYTSYFNALRRIPFEEGPYYLFRNTLPLFIKHTLMPFTAFFSYDWLVDKLSVIWRTSNTPMWPVKLFCAGFSTWLGAVFSYPFAVAIREMTDLHPKINGVDLYQGNYRKALSVLWYNGEWNAGWAGLFHRYFWFVAPLYFLSILAADQFGMFSYWRVDIMSGPGDNTAEDSYI